MTIQDNIDLQRLITPQVLVAIQDDGPISVQELCDRFDDAPEYIIKRAFWTLVGRGQARLNNDFDAAVVE
ncbi:hypothetical protein LCGC14_2459000 [marine sediment metagenome]|uniref:Uncharacterized protein n=1 Tax=marine sediment metagenome TaxID=412755 RepID=A0A0F9BDR7_9ZZZZ